jgi:hypothetical protein
MRGYGKIGERKQKMREVAGREHAGEGKITKWNYFVASCQ